MFYDNFYLSVKIFTKETNCTYYITVYSILCSRVMKYSSVNKMQSINLAIVFGPIIMHDEVNVIATASQVPIERTPMEAFLTDYDTIFT